MRYPHEANSSRSALASFRSRVSKPLGKPPIDRSEQFARLLRLALVAPEPREAHRGAEFPGLGFLSSCYLKSTIENISLPSVHLVPAISEQLRPPHD